MLDRNFRLGGIQRPQFEPDSRLSDTGGVMDNRYSGATEVPLKRLGLSTSNLWATPRAATINQLNASFTNGYMTCGTHQLLSLVLLFTIFIPFSPSL